MPILATYNLSEIPGFNDIINNVSCENAVNDYNSNILKTTNMECRTSENAVYKIIKYDKNMLSFDLVRSYGLCRSVIINSNNKVVSFAPPKSIPCDHFIQSYPENTENIVAEEFIEGTMVNVFWDESIGLTGGWEIATRNTVGATSSFYKGKNAKTFRTMFLEAAKENNLSLDELPKKNSYSFVLQHPENRIVVPFKKPQLYLVAIYSIQNETDDICITTVNLIDYIIYFNALNITVKFPKVYTFNRYSELIEKYASMNTSYDIVGVVLHNTENGERAKIRNPVYEQVRNLRGNQPKLQYQYLSLRKEGRVGDFLKFYPEHKREFSTFRDNVHLFTDTLFSNYVSCYIKKERPLSDFSDQYRTHMFNIHQIYLTDLREKKLFVNSTVVIKYVNAMPPSLLMYCLNFQMRKRHVNTIIADRV
jgi:hypothetical protein